MQAVDGVFDVVAGGDEDGGVGGGATACGEDCVHTRCAGVNGDGWVEAEDWSLGSGLPLWFQVG